jgi:putative hydrolase of the HAD superfamily
VEFDAVLLDVGGVLLLPDPAVTGAALREAGVAHRDDALAWAHYGGVAALDAAAGDWPQGGAPGPYLEGFVRAAGVADEQVAPAIDALRAVFTAPAIDVWARLTPWARDGLAALGALDRPVAVVSNADGTVEAQMHRHRLAQVGPGPGLAVAAIVDSAVVGVAKPDPAVFAPALEALARTGGALLLRGRHRHLRRRGRAGGGHDLHPPRPVGHLHAGRPSPRPHPRRRLVRLTPASSSQSTRMIA